MIDVIKSLNLTDKANSFYKMLYGKRPLTLNEMHLLKNDITKNELIEIINELFQARLITRITPEDSSIVAQYIIVPPFFTIGEIITQIKKSLAGRDDSIMGLENIIDKIFENQSNIELDNIYKDFKKLQDDINNDINTIKQELDKLLDQIEKKEDKLDFLGKFEVELRNIINSELASIVIILLQMKAEFQDKLKNIGISNSQWNSLKDEIKDTLALGIHEKSSELGEIVAEEFKEIKNELKEQQMDILKDRFEQKSVYLGILNMFKTEIDKFHKALLLKKNNLSLDLKSLEKSINTDVIQTFQNLIENASENILCLEEFFQTFLEGYSGISQSAMNEFWSINSIAKFNEEISNIIKKSSEKLVIIVPIIDDFVPINALLNSADTIKIELISSESHNNEVVKSIKNKTNIEFKRLKNNKNFIGLFSDNAGLSLGLYLSLEKDPLRNVVGFGTNNKSMIEFLIPLFSEKREAAKPTKEIQINKAFNFIIENINEIKGKKISSTLQKILDIIFKMKGISLDVLELKLLISKLQNVNRSLDTDWKIYVIEKIKEFNKKFSTLELITPPEFKTPASEGIKEEIELVPLAHAIKLDYLEDAHAMFDLFLEKLEGLKGIDLSKELDKIIEMVIKFQGYSNIVEWKESLSTIDDIPQEPFIEKLREDLNIWKNDLLTPKTTIQTPSEPLNESMNLEDVEYFSPALSEISESIEELPAEIVEEKNIFEIFGEISQNLEHLTGSEISSKLQQIMDITLETKGYSMALKDMRQWISKLRMIKNPLVDEVKFTFKEKLEKWREESS